MHIDCINTRYIAAWDAPRRCNSPCNFGHATKISSCGMTIACVLNMTNTLRNVEFCCTVFNIFAREIIICHCYHISNIVWIALVNGSAGTVASCRLKNSCCMGLPWRKLIAQRIVSCGLVALTAVWCNYLFIFVLQLHILLNISLWSST